MQPHQQRVVAERADLLLKAEALSKFIDTPTFAGLPQIEQQLLVRQLHYMVSYAGVLGQRIELWSFPASL